MVDPNNQGLDGARGWHICSCDYRYRQRPNVHIFPLTSIHGVFTFHLPLDEGTTKSGFQSSKRALFRTRHGVPERNVDPFRRVQLGITRWAFCRKELGHTNPAWANMHARARLCISYPLKVLQIAHVTRLQRGQARIQELAKPVHPGIH